MLKKNLNLAWRNLLKAKGYSLLNILGLAIGIAVFTVTLVYVNHETGYDRWDPRQEDLYRLGISRTEEGEKSENFWTPYPLGTQMATNLPEVEAVTRLFIQGEQTITVKENSFYENKLISADSSFFKVFPYTFIEGAAATAFTGPNQVVITRAMRDRYFAGKPAMGELLELASPYQGKRQYKVTGVVEPEGPSHLDFSACFSMYNRDPNYWGRQIYITYAVLKKNANMDQLIERSSKLLAGGYAAYMYQSQSKRNPKLQAPGGSPEEWLRSQQQVSELKTFFEPVSRIHLGSRATGWRDAASNHPAYNVSADRGRSVLVFSIAALVILVLACINYTNLAVARAAKRAREAGVRKVLGAARGQLVLQFMTEALLQVLLAGIVSLLLGYWLIEMINSNFKLNLELWSSVSRTQNLNLLLQLGGILLLVTLISGSYPSMVLSGFKPASVLKGEMQSGGRGRWIRNSLVVVQFAISAAFVIGVSVVWQQLSYMRNNDPGFSGEQVLMLKPSNTALITPGSDGDRAAYIKQSLQKIQGVRAVAATEYLPGAPALAVQEASYEGKIAQLSFGLIDYDYFDILKMQLIAGRGFDRSYGLDSVEAAVINETTVRKLGIQQPLGAKISIMDRRYTIIGVLKDNLADGYDRKVAPMIYAIGIEPGMMYYTAMLVKIDGQQAAAALTGIHQFWKTLEPDFPLRSSWLDDDFAKLMVQHERFGALASLLAVISILIALMGIFALSAYAASQRTREIGIRKVFGASVGRITTILSRDFVKLVLLGQCIAIPLAIWLMNSWLNGFAYRVSISWALVALAELLVLLIALATVSVQAILAARANPISVLRE